VGGCQAKIRAQLKLRHWSYGLQPLGQTALNMLLLGLQAM